MSISNYRSLKDCNISLAPFVCIVGENNAGKSTILLALSLFFSGTKLSLAEFYDPSLPIRIEITFEEITQGDINRIPDEHRERILSLINEGKLKLLRKYQTDGSSELLCKRLMPKDERFDLNQIGQLLRGLRGNAIGERLRDHLPEFASRFEGVTTQAAAQEIIQEIIRTLPANELEEREQPLPTGIPNSIRSLLPEPILIPAVKDVTDDIKTKESATFGKLISILLKDIEDAEEVQHIIKSFDELHSLLNKSVTQDGETVDHRLTQVKEIESLISQYLQESFPRVELELKIPPPELKQVFSNAQILIDDGVKDIVETKGDGLKRSVTFALLRSYADKKKNPTHNAGGITASAAPYLFLFEEPELYLHPSAQRVLFDALVKISERHQVIVTTHSPMFFSPTAIGTFIKMVKKYPEIGKPYGHAITIDLLGNMSARDAFQIICFENNSAAFFANKVVLVEGDSDLCFYKHVAKVLNREWDFDARNIPIVRIYGKGNVRRYRDFFTAFGIDVYVILDLDVLISDFDKLGVSENSNAIRNRLIEALDQIAEAENIDGSPTREKIKEMVRRYTWRERYERLKVLAGKVTSGRTLTEEEIEEINLLFSEEVDTKRKMVLKRDMDQVPFKNELLTALREEKVFVLSKGTVEDYYPAGVSGEDKPSKALHACTMLRNRDSIMAVCPLVTDGEDEVLEFEAIFKRIFA